MSSTPAPSDMGDDTAPWFYDGVVALRRHPALTIGDDHFTLHDGGATFGPYAWQDLIAQEAASGASVFGHRDLPGWRLEFRGPPPSAFTARAAPRPIYGGWVDRWGLPRATIGLAAIAAVALLLILRLPAWLTPLVPHGWEDRLGDAMTHTLEAQACHSGAGDAALRTLVARVDAGREARRVSIIDDPAINAVAFPGGHILVYRGLLDKVASPDAVAGVIGHELGHVHHRDGITALIREFGLSTALGGFNGNGGNYTRAMLALRYGREAEARADEWSRAALRTAAIDPRPTARFFADFAKREGDGTPTWMSTHPASRERSARFTDAPAGTTYRPTLDASSWQALRTICAKER